MRKLVITENITLDGSIEMLGEWFDPQGQGDMSDLMAEIHRQHADADALLVGRQTFEDLRGGWQNSTVLTGDPIARVRDLKEREGRDIVLTGSITLAHAVITAGLVDEYRLFVYPVVQRRGRRLFPEGHEIAWLRLVDTRSFTSGVSLLVYAPRA